MKQNLSLQHPWSQQLVLTTLTSHYEHVEKARAIRAPATERQVHRQLEHPPELSPWATPEPDLQQETWRQQLGIQNLAALRRVAFGSEAAWYKAGP